MSNATRNTRLLALTVGALLCSAVATSSFAATQWEKNHPRRDQVNDRLARQNARIHHEVKEGDLTKAQAAKLHKDDRQIRGEERAMASQNGGHITKTEQKALNQQENAVSKQIGK
jgi:Spy/CpxP family protein refolding chaperone